MHRASVAAEVVLALSWLAGSATGSAPAKAGPLLRRALAGPLAGASEIVFAVRSPGRDGHWYANFGYWTYDADRMMYGPGGGRLCKLDLRTRKVTVLLDDPDGAVRDPHVGYDGRKVLFSYRRGTSRYYHLYEMSTDPSTKLAAGGIGLRQITDGPWDDIEPIALPDGQILFCSSRCKRWVPCYETHVATLHRCKPDGREIRCISANVEHDNTPAVLPDGRVLFTRWEYVDRSELCFHHLWTINPDGTGQMIYFGNMHPGTVMIDARPIPGSPAVVCIFSPGHGRREHAGRVTVVTPDAGPDEKALVRHLGAGRDFRDPFPLAEDLFLVAEKRRLLLMDGRGRTEVVHALSGGHSASWLHEPRPIRPRRREPLITDRTDWSQATGRLLLSDVTQGRNMGGVRRGEIRKLLVLEVLPKPVGFGGVPHALSWWGTLNLERVVGTVPVEPDGSGSFELPAMRSFFFVALDAHDATVKRMQSFVSVMPGETTGCSGCHEPRNRTARFKGDLAALGRPPSRVAPVRGVPDVLDFPRDIQPILDRHCTRCHGGAKRSGGIVLTGGRGPIYSHSYWTLLAREQIADGRNGLGNRAPRTIGASASPLMKRLKKASRRERERVRLWIETGAAYSGTYASLGTGKLYDGDIFLRFTLAGRFAKLFEGRCTRCHAGELALQAKPLRGRHHIRTFRPRDPVIRFSEHLIYDFTEPEKSLALLAPLSPEAGGYGACRAVGQAGKHGRPVAVFASRRDPLYQRMLATIREGKAQLDRVTRFDMPGFRPADHYVREMQRYGVLPPDLDAASQPIDAYQTDQAYWRSLWHRPG